MDIQKKELKNKDNQKIKKLLSTSVIKKNNRVDTEKILHEELFPKFGERYNEYRAKYENYLNDKSHKFLPNYPISVILELVNRCNLECTMCFQGFRNDTKKYTLEIEQLKKLFNEFKENKLDAILFSNSEPLLYKKFPEVLELAAKAGIMDQFLFTNGTLLNKKNSEIILNSSLTRLFVSLDAATESTYDKVRIPVNKKKINTNRLRHIETNIKNFVSLRKALNKKLPLTRVSFVALESNYHEVDQFIEKWIDIVDTVEIQKENSINFYEDLHKKKYDTSKLVLSEYNCNEPWGQVGIHADGTVGPCCNTVGRNLPVGNVLEQSLKEIWQNEKMKEIREGFINNKPNIICKLCLENEKVNI